MATNFFAAQDAARSRSRRLIFLFLASVAGLILSIYLAFMAFAIWGNDGKGFLWNPEVFVGTAGAVILIVGVSSLGKMMSLRSGGGSVARSVGGRLVDPLTLDTDERRLINIVEEMSIAAGVPLPEIYVLDEEDGINAFAAGYGMRDAAVAVTRGCMEKLSRDELQGVIAHEFSHILNGDMRLNIQLIGLVFGLLALAVFGQVLLRFGFFSNRGKRSDKDGAAFVTLLLILGLILYVAGWVGVFFGRLLQSAVSRQREFLADASAVQFTRNPTGLAGALCKIGSDGSRVANPHSQDIAHLFFANGLKMKWWGLFATHPPLPERIRAIDPAWDGTFKSPPPLPRNEPMSPPLPAAARMKSQNMMVAAAGAMDQLERAQVIHKQLSELLGDGWRDPATATALILALLPPAQECPETDDVRDYREKLSVIAPGERLVLINILMPALGRLSEKERAALLDQLNHLGHENSGFTAFDFGSWWVVRRNLQRFNQSPKAKEKLHNSPADFALDVSILLASLAHIGADNNEEAAKAFAAAVESSASFRALCAYPGQQPDIAQLDQALQNLDEVAFSLRQEILNAAACAIASDKKITESEAALIQLVSLALNCPVPL